MMSEYFDHHHRWEPLAEFHFSIDDNEDMYNDSDDNYSYCLCSRVFIRDGVRTYWVEKEGSESEAEILQQADTIEWTESHVHFSLDTSEKETYEHDLACQKDEGASCYCSASHTENYCSTDEHDVAHINYSHNLQPSDSGADLTYHDGNSDFRQPSKKQMEQDVSNPINNTNENYLSENTWEKFWTVNGERLIWASWIKNYSDYINPEYMDENNDLLLDENNVPIPQMRCNSAEDFNVPKQHSIEPLCSIQETRIEEVNGVNCVRERKFSYDSKVNPYHKRKSVATQNSVEKDIKCNDTMSNNEIWLPVPRRRSCSENEQSRILSPRTLACTDSMTNVTKITLSSYDATSSHVTSESSSADDYSVSSSMSNDPSNDKTRIANIDESQNQVLSEEQDVEEYWQLLWKKHFGEQYALHYANYIEANNFHYMSKSMDTEKTTTHLMEEHGAKQNKLDNDCENSESNSQATLTLVEAVSSIDMNEPKTETKVVTREIQPKKKRDKLESKEIKYINSIGFLLQNLRKEDNSNNTNNIEVTEAGDNVEDKSGTMENDTNGVQTKSANTTSNLELSGNIMLNKSNDGDDDDDPPKESSFSLKRSHEIDEDEDQKGKVKSTFEIMGFSTDPEKMPKGVLVYKKRVAKLRPPRQKKYFTPKKTYFDDYGNPYQESQGEDNILTDEDCLKNSHKIDEDSLVTVNSSNNFAVPNAMELNNEDSMHNIALQASNVPFPSDSNIFSDQHESIDENQIDNLTNENLDKNMPTGNSSKRKKRNKRSKQDESSKDVNAFEIPAELQDEPKMIKYWKKRHSLFHRFDDGIKLDRESWFSVTPENVARHIAKKYEYDVVLDGFCGAGGNTIQFARTSKKVIAVDIDPAKIELAKHNATIYGVVDKIEFIVGDFFEIAESLEADMVFLSPPWGGPKYSENPKYDLETMLEPKPISELMRIAWNITSNVTLYLPRNSRCDQILQVAKEACVSVEIEQNYLDRRFVAITAYYY